MYLRKSYYYRTFVVQTLITRRARCRYKSPGQGREKMSKEEVIEKIKRDMSGCYTCSYSCDEQGYNGSFSSQYVNDLFKEENQVDDDNVWCLLHEGWELLEFEPVTNDDIDIYEWAQEFDNDTIEYMKKDIDAGGYYIATFCDDTWGTQKILVW